MLDFTPWTALLGGTLIGVSATLLLLASGRVAGISAIAAGLLLNRGDRAWRFAFLLGLVGAGLVAARVAAERIGEAPHSPIMMGIAGLVVGVGTRVGGGCTSGHGVCGISRLSRRSLVATVVFVVAGIATVAIGRLLGAGP